MALTLKVHRKEGAQLLEFGEGTLKVGRGGGSHIVVDDRAASRMHCVIEVPKAGPPVVIDLGSSTARPDRSLCPFCKRPYPAAAFACPACGAPAPS